MGRAIWNALKGGGIKMREGKKMPLKKRGKLGQGVGVLKRGAWNPLQTMVNVGKGAILGHLIGQHKTDRKSIKAIQSRPDCNNIWSILLLFYALFLLLSFL